MSEMSVYKFKILVVDDDITSLNVVSSMLRTLQYEVFSINCAENALPIARSGDIDLVLSDLHMPGMDGLQLQKQIEAESNLPVVIMSSDEDEKMMLKSLTSGAVFFISKPVSPTTLKSLWQYAILSNKDKSSKYIEKIKNIQAAEPLLMVDNNIDDDEEDNNNRCDDKQKGNTKYCKRKAEKEEMTNIAPPKKPKVVWNDTLHNLFMHAIRHITLERAVPRTILEYMNVPGLTRENVASHLQKYRIFLKKIAEKGYGPYAPGNSMTLDTPHPTSTFSPPPPTTYPLYSQQQQQPPPPSSLIHPNCSGLPIFSNFTDNNNLFNNNVSMETSNFWNPNSVNVDNVAAKNVPFYPDPNCFNNPGMNFNQMNNNAQAGCYQDCYLPNFGFDPVQQMNREFIPNGNFMSQSVMEPPPPAPPVVFPAVAENPSWDEPSLEQLLEIEKLLNLESLEDNNDANSGNGNQPMQDQTSKKDVDDDFIESLLNDSLL